MVQRVCPRDRDRAETPDPTRPPVSPPSLLLSHHARTMRSERLCPKTCRLHRNHPSRHKRLGSAHTPLSTKADSASEMPSSTLQQPSWPQAAAPPPFTSASAANTTTHTTPAWLLLRRSSAAASERTTPVGATRVACPTCATHTHSFG